MKKSNAFVFVLSMLMLVGCDRSAVSSVSSKTSDSTQTSQTDSSSVASSVTQSSNVEGNSSVSASSVTPDSSSSASSNVKKVSVTFNLNYKGAPKASVVPVEKGKTVTAPTDPTRDGKAFIGWSVDSESTQIYDFTYPVNKDMTLYAAWGETGAEKLKGYTFEAEYCPCITDGQGMQGSTYSGGTSGQGLIQEDYDGSAEASNRFWVHFLYNKGDNLIFNIESDKAVSNATIYMRLSAEYRGPMEINATKYPVKLNDEAISYESIFFPNVPAQGAGWLAFEDYPLGINLSLKQGTNKIEMITDNDEWLYGTALSTAPMVDCLKFSVPEDVNLTWPTAKYSNIISEDE